MTTAKRMVRVVGSGPAGLMAAEVLATGGRAVEIWDHHASPARKFLLAGRGGLNLTHSEPLHTMITRYGGAAEKLAPAISAFPPEALREWCHGLGVPTFVGSSGRVFPSSLKASPVLRAWLRRLSALGVTLKSQTPWTGFDDVPTLLALGGASWPELGSDAAWVDIFTKAGIAVTTLQPSNSRQRVAWSEVFATRFAGQPIKNIAAHCGGIRTRGEIMLARDGIEGGAIYALSQPLRDGQPLVLDLKPDLSVEDVERRLARPKGKQSRSTFLRKVLNLSPAAIGLMHETGATSPKHVAIPVQGSLGFRRAISTAGGVAWHEVDEGYRLLKQPNTWVAGEMLDWDAPTGGYLLQACFSTAHAAANALLHSTKNN